MCVFGVYVGILKETNDDARGIQAFIHINRASEGWLVAFKGFVPHYDRGIRNADRGAETGVAEAVTCLIHDLNKDIYLPPVSDDCIAHMNYSYKYFVAPLK